MFIRSERLFLRPGWPEDREELLNRINDWAVVRQFEVPAPGPLDLHAARDGQGRRFPHFVVTLPTSDGSRLIGCVGLTCGAHGPELVYWTAPEYWGRGYATESGRAVLSLARTLGHRRITAIHFADNSASQRVLGKLGFHATGETYRRLCPARRVLAASLVHCRDLVGRDLVGRDLGEPSDCDAFASEYGRNDERRAA